MRLPLLLTTALLATAGAATAAEARAPGEVAPAARSRPRQVREIGFQQLPSVSRVFVRTSAPGRFSIADAGEKTIVVELENTRPRSANDLRALDTSFFASPVTRIEPRREGSAYLVAITLRERVEYRQKIEGDVLALDFESTGRPLAGPVPATVAPREGSTVELPAASPPAEEPAPREPAPVAPRMQ